MSFIKQLLESLSRREQRATPMPVAEPRCDRNGNEVKGIPEDVKVPVVPQVSIPKDPWIFPKNTRLELDPDRGGVMPEGKPSIVLIHHTVSYHTKATVDFFKKNAVDVHFVIGHEGEIIQMVECNRQAAHAGESSWAGKSGLNKYAIGIEVVNIGPLFKTKVGMLDYYNYEKWKKGEKYKVWDGAVRERKAEGFSFWEPFTPAQERAVTEICLWAMQVHGIPLANIVGHYETSPGRKNDPAGGFSHGNMDAYRTFLGGMLKAMEPEIRLG